MKPSTKPTARAGTLLVAALVLYFFANQTQVGWLYLMSAVMAGCVVASAWLNRSTLRSITADRAIHLITPAPFPGTNGVTARIADALHEGDQVEITLRLRAAHATAQITLQEICPITEEPTLREQALYVPRLGRSNVLEYAYAVGIDRRGVHRFDPLSAESRAPFGIFARRGTIAADGALLVYPEINPLRTLELLDRNLTLQKPRARAGQGSEIIGARPYRPGDSPRHIHWRSSARVGQLISKEFAEDAQPTLLLILDCFAHRNANALAFEIGVKVAASLGEYALRGGYRLIFEANDHTDHKMKRAAHDSTWHTLLERLARVQPTGTQRLADMTATVTQSQIAVVLPYADASVIARLSAFRASGIQVLVVLVETAHDDDSAAVASKLGAAGVDARIVRTDDDWAAILSARTVMTAQTKTATV